MKKTSGPILCAFVVSTAIGLSGGVADANVSSCPGTSFHAFNASQAGYITGTPGSYAQIENTNGGSVEVVGQIPYQSANTVYVTLTGDAYSGYSSTCYAVVTNGVGNEVWIGAPVTTTGSSLTWQTLNLTPSSPPPVYGGSALLVICSIYGAQVDQPAGGALGLAWQ